MLSDLKSDILKLFIIDGGENPSIIEKCWLLVFGYGFQAIVVYRFGRFLDSLTIKFYYYPVYYFVLLIYYFLKYIVEIMYGISIDKKALIGKRFYIGHFGNIKIGRCIIGNNCSVHQNVWIGITNKKKNSCPPEIGNNVWVGGHSVIECGITIDDDSTILVGSTVKSDVGKGNLVMGDPARVIRKNYDNSSLLRTFV